MSKENQIQIQMQWYKYLLHFIIRDRYLPITNRLLQYDIIINKKINRVLIRMINMTIIAIHFTWLYNYSVSPFLSSSNVHNFLFVFQKEQQILLGGMVEWNE